MATQHTDREAKFNGTCIQHLTLIGVPNLDLIGRSISVQNLDLISRSAAQPLQMENGNQNRSPMENGQPYNRHRSLENGNCNIYIQNLNLIGCSAAQPHPLRIENGNQRSLREMIENAQPYNGHRSRPSCAVIEGPRTRTNVEKMKQEKEREVTGCSAAQPHPLRIENGNQRSLRENGQPLRIENGNQRSLRENAEPYIWRRPRPSCAVIEGTRTRTNVEKMKQEKEREVTEYKAWLKKNITRLTDSWTSNKTGWKGATNSNLDLTEKERLFRNHVNELHKQYLREYSQLLKEVITQDLEIKYLELWSCAKSLMVRRERFRLLPEPEMESEWRRHVEQISKKKGTSREKGKQQ